MNESEKPLGGNASILFEYKGKRYVYDGGLPDAVEAMTEHLRDDEGYWLEPSPDSLPEGDTNALPTAIWEIEHIGGKVLEVRGARSNGAIYWEDWLSPRIY